MANPTTNFGWVMPSATDLVTDLPADFNVFGQGVDTSMADLLGGTTGQVLAKNSNTNMDFIWTTPQVGDITAVTAGTGISGGGTGGDVTITNSMATAITTAGDVIYGTGSGTFSRLGIGTANQVLRVNSGATAPEWATVGGGGKVLQVVQGTKTSNFTTTSSSYVDSGLSVSITPTSATSKVMIFVGGWAQIAYSGSTTTVQGSYNLVRTSTQLQSFQKGYYNFASSSSPEIQGPINLSYLDSPATTSATTYKMQMKSDSGASATIYLSASATQIASIVAMEIGA